MKHGFASKSVDEVVAACIEHEFDESSSGRIFMLEELYPDPIERIEYEYGPTMMVRNVPAPNFWGAWDNKRLEIATDPRYMDRARESYAFQDLIGREYNGVVFE